MSQAKRPTKLNPIVEAAGVMAIDNQNTDFRQRAAAARQMNNSWDDVNRLSGLCRQLLLNATGLLPSIRNQQLVAQIEDKQAWGTNAHILARDLMTFTNEFQALEARHRGKQGDAQGPDENMDAIDLSTQYAMFAERYEAVLQPTVMHVIELIQHAEAKLREIDNDAADALGVQTSAQLAAVKGLPSGTDPLPPTLTPEQDPNVVTDVTPNPATE
jgi:hypothetical protein